MTVHRGGVAGRPGGDGSSDGDGAVTGHAPGEGEAPPERQGRAPWRRRAAGLAVAAFSGGAIWLAVRGMDWDRLATLFAGVAPGWVAVAAVCLAAGLALRALRWTVLLRARHAVSPADAFWCVVLGYLGNVLMPARIGDLLRSFLLGGRAGVPRAFVLGTVVLERTVDAVVVAALVLIGLPRLAGAPAWLVSGSLAVAGLAAVVLVAFLAAPGVLRRLARRRPGGEAAPGPVAFAVQRLTDGFLAVRRPASLVGFHLLTVLVWTVDTLALVAAARAFDLVLAPLDAALVLAALGLSMAAPSGPGYVGIYHLVAVTVMVPMGFAKAEALAVVLVYQLTDYALLAVLSPIALWRLDAWHRLTGWWRRRRPEPPE